MSTFTLLVEHVLVGADVRAELADVLPVALGHVAVQRVASFEQRREHVAREVDHLALGDEVEHLGLEHVDAGVDGVGEHLAPGGLLEESLDGAVGTRDHDPELERVLHVLQRDRRGGAGVAVRLHERGEVDVGEDVARRSRGTCRRAPTDALRTDPAVPSGESSVA